MPMNVFISYAHEDSAIAVALSNMLQRTFGETLSEVFLDTNSIDIGGEITVAIKEALRRADVLLVVSTGVLRPSHSWTGFELGYFEACRTSAKPDSKIRGKVITLCRAGSVPSPMESRRYVNMSFEENLLDETEENLEAQIVIQDNDELVTLLGDILFEASGERLAGRADLRGLYKTKVKEFKKAVHRVFKSRVKLIRKPQKQLLVRYNNRNVDTVHEELPGDTVITSVGGALELFGIQEEDPALAEVQATEIPLLGGRNPGTLKAKAITWERFRARVSENTLVTHWCSALARVVISGGTFNVNVDNSQVVVSHDGLRRFRLVLTTSTTFYNGDVEASVYLVESLQRPNYGRADTTLLLKGLHLVCRFRFMFLETESEYYWLNVHQWTRKQIPNLARQLIAELDLIRTEAREAQLDKPGTWAAFVSIDELVEMGRVWAPLEESVRTLCLSAIEKAPDETALMKIRNQLELQLKELSQSISPHNAALLKAMSVKLADLATSAASPRADARPIRGASVERVAAGTSVESVSPPRQDM